MIAHGIDKHLGFVFEPSKGLCMQNPISVALETCSDRVFSFGSLATEALGSFGCEGGEKLGFTRLDLLANRIRHSVSDDLRAV